MLFLLDNYDSFTYNLVYYFRELGVEVVTKRNDEVSIETIKALAPSKICISPGPGTPASAGISNAIIQKLGAQIPILGVCLGHQCIGEVFGACVVQASEPMHGKTSLIYHQNSGVFQKLPQPFEATRYHSLLVDPRSIPACLEITAQTESQEIMGLKHSTLPIHGVQFHPESILSTAGKQLLQNFLDL